MPLSNLNLKVVDTLASHPLRQLLDADVLVTVNSDDPPYLGGYINDNYAAIADALRLDARQITRLARNSFTASFLDPAAVSDQQRRIDRYIASQSPGQP